MENLKFGLVVGQGTGRELSDVFRRCCADISSVHGKNIEILECETTFDSFFSCAETDNFKTVSSRAKFQAKLLVKFYENAIKSNCSAIFRTAINAESLYIARNQLESIKIEHLHNGNLELITVRDQFNGFYSGTNDYFDEFEFLNTSKFSKKSLHKIVNYTYEYAKAYWKDEDFQINVVYKFHLFDSRFKDWVDDLKLKNINVMQPDTASRLLTRNNFQGKQVFVGSNEWLDVIHVFLLKLFQNHSQEESYSINHFIADEFKNITEFQTVHGSADNLQGQNIVNPLATIRAASKMLQLYGNYGRVVDRMEQAIKLAIQNKVCTPDMNGKFNTLDMFDYLLKCYQEIYDGTIDYVWLE